MLKNNCFETALEQVISQPWISDKTRIRIYIHKEIIDENGLIRDQNKCLYGSWFNDNILDIITDGRMSGMMTGFNYDIKNDTLSVYIFER